MYDDVFRWVQNPLLFMPLVLFALIAGAIVATGKLLP